MANLASTDPVEALIRALAPVDMTAPFDRGGVAGKVIVITGGGSGLGAAFAREWAAHGAHLFIGDVDDAAGEALVAELRRSSSGDHHYQHCDVTDWASQVAFFKAAVAASPTGGIDAVVPNAGIAKEASGGGGGFEDPRGLDEDAPAPPSLDVLDVNLTGVLYTVHLGLFWLGRNPSQKWRDAVEAEVGGGGGGAEEDEAGRARRRKALEAQRDRHILLIGSIGGIMPLGGAVKYTVSKHAVTGLFRTLRGSCFWRGIRVNMLLPCFVDTGMVPNEVLFCLAGGGGLARLDDVVEAGTRFMADKNVAGRGFVIGPRLRVEDGEDGRTRLVRSGEAGEERAYWECYVHDYDSVEAFVYRYTRLLAAYTHLRGWVGWLGDVVRLMFRRPAKK